MIGQEGGHFKRNPSRWGSSIKLLLSSPSSSASLDMPPSFTTDMSNHLTTDLFPIVTGQHARAVYSLDHAVGTITQTDTHAFSRSFDSTGHYPTNPRICLLNLLRDETSSNPCIDRGMYVEGED